MTLRNIVQMEMSVFMLSEKRIILHIGEECHELGKWMQGALPSAVIGSQSYYSPWQGNTCPSRSG